MQSTPLSLSSRFKAERARCVFSRSIIRHDLLVAQSGNPPHGSLHSDDNSADPLSSFDVIPLVRNPPSPSSLPRAIRRALCHRNARYRTEDRAESVSVYLLLTCASSNATRITTSPEVLTEVAEHIVSVVQVVACQLTSQHSLTSSGAKTINHRAHLHAQIQTFYGDPYKIIFQR